MTEGDVGREHVVLTLQNVAADRELDTLVGHLTDVLHLVGVTQYGSQVTPIEQVAGGVPVELRSNGQTAVEQRDVGSQVAGDGGLPLDVLVRETGTAVVAIILLTELCHLAKTRTTGGVDGIKYTPHVVVDTVVTGKTEGSANLQLANPVNLLHERFLADDPCTRDGGEVTPLVARGELGATVGTERSRQEVAVLPVVAGLTEERSGAVGCRQAGGRLIRSTEAHVVPSLAGREGAGEVAVGNAVGTGLRVVDFLTQQERPVVSILHAEVIAGGIGPYIAQLVGVGDGCHGLVVVVLASAGQCAVETALVSPVQTDSGLCA